MAKMYRRNNDNIKKGRIKNKRKGTFKKILLIILLIIMLAGIFFTYRTIKNGGGVQGILATIFGHDEKTVENLEPIYCLLMGESEYLTDTIMVASYNPKTQEASLLSIPRDTFIGNNKNTATPSDKINSLYRRQYPEKVLTAVSNIIGIELEYYAIVDTKALIELVDLIGGVWFDVPIDMNYHDITQDLAIELKKGYQLMEGNKAEQVLRFRHNDDGTTYPEEYGTEDLGRMRTQRAFIEATINQTLKAQNLTKIWGVIDIIHENLNTNVSLSTIKDYIPYAINFSTSNLRQGTLPGILTVCNHYWFYLHDEEQTKVLVNELFNNIENKDNIITAPSEIKIGILNGSNKNSNLNNLRAKLRNKDYNVVSTENTNTVSKTEIINNTGLGQADLNKIIEVIGLEDITITENSNNTQSESDITIIIGKDY